MKIPLQIAFRNTPKSEAVEADIARHAAKLEAFCDHIISCRVTVEAVARHKHQGRLYAVHVDLKAPGEEIVSTRRHEHEDVYVAIRDAFDAVRRRLQDYVRKQRGQTKPHAVLARGRIVRLFADEGHGFIEDDEGNEYYFDRASVDHPDFDRLAVGDRVEFLPERADLGRQAKRVSAVARRAA